MVGTIVWSHRHETLVQDTLWFSARRFRQVLYFFALLPAQMGLSKTLQVFYQAHSFRNMAALQEVLRMACGFTVEQGLAYTLHSPRHFLPEAAAARGELGTCRCEIGRWSQSVTVTQLASLRPETNMMHKHRDKGARLPDLYAKNNATQRPLTILNRQMGAMCTYHKKCGPGNLRLYGGLIFLTIFKKTGGPHED